METAKVSSKNQIVIPKKIREALHVTSGSEVVMEPMGNVVIMMPKPENYAEYSLGLGAEAWKRVDPLKYVRGERNSWEKR